MTRKKLTTAAPYITAARTEVKHETRQYQSTRLQLLFMRRWKLTREDFKALWHKRSAARWKREVGDLKLITLLLESLQVQYFVFWTSVLCYKTFSNVQWDISSNKYYSVIEHFAGQTVLDLLNGILVEDYCDTRDYSTHIMKRTGIYMVHMMYLYLSSICRMGKR